MTDVHREAVVVGVDGSQHSERAVRWAAEQARLQHRPLLVVAVAEAEGITAARDIASAAVGIARHHEPGIDAEVLTEVGDPRSVLVDASRTAHLLVLGSRGRGAIRSLLLGSVSTAVLKATACPLVICRPPRGGERRPGVLVAADGTAESLPVIEFAFEQAALRGLPLTVVHCFWDVIAAVAGFREASGEFLADQHLEELRLVLAESTAGFSERFPDVEVTTMLRHGLVDEALSERGKKWDLIVVGRHPVVGLSRTLTGSIATAVVERAHSTVAVVPEAPGGPEDPDE